MRSRFAASRPKLAKKRFTGIFKIGKNRGVVRGGSSSSSSRSSPSSSPHPLHHPPRPPPPPRTAGPLHLGTPLWTSSPDSFELLGSLGFWVPRALMACLDSLSGPAQDPAGRPRRARRAGAWPAGWPRGAPYFFIFNFFQNIIFHKLGKK